MIASEIKCVCFDLFHTLVNVGLVPKEIGVHTAEFLNINRNAWSKAIYSNLHEIRQHSDPFQMMKTLVHSIDTEISLEKIKAATQQRQLMFDYALENVSDAILQTLAKLKSKGIKLALISNASTAEVGAWPRSPLQAYLEPAIFSCEAGYAKPEKQIYQIALDAFSVAAKHTLFVGDGGSNELAGAKQVGMWTARAAWYDNGLWHNKERLEKCRQASDVELTSISQLLELIAVTGKK